QARSAFTAGAAFLFGRSLDSLVHCELIRRDASMIAIATSLTDVLIVDDDADTRTSLRLLLEMAGFACEEAADGLLAIELARRLLPRIVLLDVMLPELNGLKVMRQLRANEKTRDIRVYCFTGRADPEVQEAARLLGCAQFFIKPTEPDDIIAQIRAEVRPSEQPVEE